MNYVKTDSGLVYRIAEWHKQDIDKDALKDNEAENNATEESLFYVIEGYENPEEEAEDILFIAKDRQRAERYIRMCLALDSYYETVIEPRRDNGKLFWYAYIPELPGCGADSGGGRHPEDALANLVGAKSDWLHKAFYEGKEIPLPKHIRSEEAYRSIVESGSAPVPPEQRFKKNQRVIINAPGDPFWDGLKGWVYKDEGYGVWVTLPKRVPARDAVAFRRDEVKALDS